MPDHSNAPVNSDVAVNQSLEAQQFSPELGASLAGKIRNFADTYRQQKEIVSFARYIEMVKMEPALTRTAFQRVYDMILSYGVSTDPKSRDKTPKYNLFNDPFNNGKDAVFGIREPLAALVGAFQAAAMELGMEKRVFLLHGPVGSVKSTIARLLKRGLEAYTATEEGKLMTLGWKLDDGTIAWCPMREEPLRAIPAQLRPEVEAYLNAGKAEDQQKIRIREDLCPCCKQYQRQLLESFDGDFDKVAGRIVTRRVVFSEAERIGIGSFQPKDEKNQDSTELTGDLNYRKIAEYGSDSDPRAFNFDGEFNVANRGMVEMVEVLKLDVAFLYDLLGVAAEHVIKPKKFAQTPVDEVILGHTNDPEYKRLQANEFMEALKSRIVIIDVPYNTALNDELAIYERDYGKQNLRAGLHVAPHTTEMAAMWAVLTRLETPKHANLSLMQKLKLYNGKTLPGFTEDNIKELKIAAPNEGFSGASPRFIQDRMSNCFRHVLQDPTLQGTINPFMVLNEIERAVPKDPLITNEETKQHYRELLALVKEEYENIVKNEVQRAIAADEDGLKRLCGNYIDNVKAYTQREKVKNRFTGQYEEPDERLMRSVESKIDIPDARKDDFRREIMNYIGALMIDGKTFDFRSNERLHRALELKLFEDQKDTIKLTSLVSQTVDQETQQKIDVVKARLIRDYGYNDVSATDVLTFVASIFARGDSKSSK